MSTTNSGSEVPIEEPKKLIKYSGTPNPVDNSISLAVVGNLRLGRLRLLDQTQRRGFEAQNLCEIRTTLLIKLFG